MADPGDVVMAGFNASKVRPWLVLWVDDDNREACVAAMTTSDHYPGVVTVEGSPKNRIASWVTLVPLDRVDNARTVGRVGRAARARVFDRLRENLGFS